MAEPQSNAPLRAPAGAPTSGVIHVRTRLTADFTVIANALAQRRGSAVTVGVAAYILSLPDGAPVRIDALCEHFTEGEILISRALRELEADGYLERRRERGLGGVLRTRTFFYDVPRGAEPEPPVPPSPPRPRRSGRSPRETERESQPPQLVDRAEADIEPDTMPGPEPSPPPTATEPDPRAVVILASLRLVDRRLLLSCREVDQLAPAVTQWLAQGVSPEEITSHLTAHLPNPLRARPDRILAYRLRELPPP
ncbi:hypothetical protein HRW07_33455, partial [Streptomyces lunaelactis]|uniref:hypothetical protein n=1 Tax=Streptomyces lunaelactis TaxID=1535768 RepID=UPI00158546A9